MIDDLISLPNGFRVTHIILLDPDWQVLANDGEHAVLSTGNTIAAALQNTLERIYAGTYQGRVHNGEPVQLDFAGSASLAERLGLVPKAAVITRRL